MYPSPPYSLHPSMQNDLEGYNLAGAPSPSQKGKGAANSWELKKSITKEQEDISVWTRSRTRGIISLTPSPLILF